MGGSSSSLTSNQPHPSEKPQANPGASHSQAQPPAKEGEEKSKSEEDKSNGSEEAEVKLEYVEGEEEGEGEEASLPEVKLEHDALELVNPPNVEKEVEPRQARTAA